MTKKIAFIKIGSFSHANASLAAALRSQFPGHEVDVIEVMDLLKAERKTVVRNLPYVVAEYGLDLLLRRRTYRQCLVRTTYIFDAFSRLAAQRSAKSRPAFSIQTQTMFDARWEGAPHFVYTDHTALANQRYPSLSQRERKAALVGPGWIERERSIYHHAQVNFPMSRFVAQSMVEDYACPPEKVVCAYAGGNLTQDLAQTAKDYAAKNILFVGVHWERKGGPELAQAFVLVLRDHPDATLTIVGCSPRLKLPNCRIVGKVPVQTVQHYYNQASLFCLPTRREPFGFVFIEAMLQKLPIVATRIGAVPDLITDGENGYSVEPNNVAALAARLSALLGQPQTLQRLGEAGYRRAIQEYTWDKVAQRMQQQIVKVVK